MNINQPEKIPIIIQKLLRGYQYSESDLYSSENENLYNNLNHHYEWFRKHLEMMGFSLVRDDSVIFLENKDKSLSNEEKQLVVVLFLLTDLWMEKGKAFADLFNLPVSLEDQDWFRDGYGRDYLLQVGIEHSNSIEDLFKKAERKGIVSYSSENQTIVLRKPAERIIDMARRIHLQLKNKENHTDE